MKLLERVNNLTTLKENWKAFCDIVGQGDSDKENELIAKIDGALMFKDKQEKEHWLDVLATYKFWEDFEELTNSIIEREEKELNDISYEFYDYALRLAKLNDFETLYNAFTTVEREWVGDISEFEKWWANQCQLDQAEYMETYKECYEKDFDIEEIKRKYVAFEKCPCIPNFFTNDEDGKTTLIECIFERYCDIFEYDGLPFYIALIFQMLNYKDLLGLLRTYKKAILEFNEDIESDNSTKGSLDRLEDVQADLYEWVEKNV